MYKRKFDSIEERLDFIEFRQELNFYNSELERVIFEYNLTRSEFNTVMDLMDKYKNKISSNEAIDRQTFESEMTEILDSEFIVTSQMCAALVKGFSTEGGWTGFYSALYGDLNI